MAIDALRANKLRAALTSLGVIIGSASIVLVVTVALTSKKFVISQIESVGSNLVWAEMVHAHGKVAAAEPRNDHGRHERDERPVPGVLEVAGTRELPMSVIVERRGAAGKFDRRDGRISDDSAAGDLIAGVISIPKTWNRGAKFV